MDWGWNPATFQAVGGIATAGALIGVGISAWAANRTARITAKESDQRTRPWVGTFGANIELESATHYRLDLFYRNVGPVPAHNIEFSMDLRPVVTADNSSEIDTTPMLKGEKYVGIGGLPPLFIARVFSS